MATATIGGPPHQHPWGAFGGGLTHLQSPPLPGFSNHVPATSPPLQPAYNPTSSQPLNPTPAIAPRNNVDLDRSKLIAVLEYFSLVVEAAFQKRPIRLVAHGGACMLLHPGLYSLSFQQHQLHPTLPHRTTTRDVDYIHRSFVIEMNQLGVTNAADKLKSCIQKTAMRFGLGADWMNSDADIALPMVNAPTGMSYDPIYYASVQPNNMDLHTIYRSTNGMVTLISVTPFWAVSLKLVRYTPQDAADICLLLRNGTELSQVQWSIDTLKEWLLANCWAMGYSTYDHTRLKQLNIRLEHAIKMVLEWGKNGSSTANSNPGISGMPRPQHQQQQQPQQQIQQHPNHSHQQPLNSSPTQIQHDSSWASVNVTFPRAVGTITPLHAMGGGGEVVGGEHGRGWSVSSGSQPSPPSAPIWSNHNSPRGHSANPTDSLSPPREPLDFSVGSPPQHGVDARRRSTAPAASSSSASVWPPGTGPHHQRFGSLPPLNGKSNLERHLETMLPTAFSPPPAGQKAGSGATSMYPYTAAGYASMHPPVIPIMSQLDGSSSSSSARKREKEKEKEKKKLKEREKKKKDKLKDKEIKRAREHTAGEKRELGMGLSFTTAADGTAISAEDQQYYQRALGYVKKSPRRDPYRDAQPPSSSSESEEGTDVDEESSDDDDEGFRGDGRSSHGSRERIAREALLQPPPPPPISGQVPYYPIPNSVYQYGPPQPAPYHNTLGAGAISSSPSGMPQSITPPSAPSMSVPYVHQHQQPSIQQQSQPPIPVPPVQQPRDQHVPPVPPDLHQPRDQHLPPIPPIASPMPMDKDRSKERKTRKEKRRTKSTEKIDPFIPPLGDHDVLEARREAQPPSGSPNTQAQSHPQTSQYQHQYQYPQHPQQDNAGVHRPHNMYQYQSPPAPQQQQQHQQAPSMYQYQQSSGLKGFP